MTLQALGRSKGLASPPPWTTHWACAPPRTTRSPSTSARGPPAGRRWAGSSSGRPCCPSRSTSPPRGERGGQAEGVQGGCLRVARSRVGLGPPQEQQPRERSASRPAPRDGCRPRRRLQASRARAKGGDFLARAGRRERRTGCGAWSAAPWKDSDRRGSGRRRFSFASCAEHRTRISPGSCDMATT